MAEAGKIQNTRDALLNEEQLFAINHEKGPLLIIAGAGTGKTRVITHRIARLIEKGVRPEKILALTFTEKAAKEMEERVDRLTPYGYSQICLGTFHSFGDNILRDNAVSIGLSPDFKVIDESEGVIFLKEHLFSLPLERYRPLADPTHYLKAIVKFIQRLKDEDVTADEYVRYAQGLKDACEDYKKDSLELALTYKAYEELKTKNGLMDFGDLITMALKMLRARPAILKLYQEKFPYILADEFQDTNYAQFEFLKLLAGGEKNITVVADDDQSIYKFRGAAISNVLNFKEFYPEAKEVTLVKNYRSIQPILDSAYRLIVNNNPDRLEVKNNIDKRLVAVRKDSQGQIRYLNFDTVGSEAAFVVKTIEEKVKTGRRSLGDFAVLVRANSDAVPFLKTMANSGIRYRFSGNSGLYMREEISLIISFLRVITNYGDNMSLFHLASSKIYNLSASDLIPCHNLARKRHTTLLNVMEDVLDGKGASLEFSKEGREKAKKLVSDVRRYSELSLREASAKLIYSFLIGSGYISMLSGEPSPESEEKIRNIARFFDVVRDIETTLEIKNVQSFVEHLNFLKDSGDRGRTAEPQDEEDFVHVLTVHKSKGLEFPVVFMVGLSADKFPRKGRKDQIDVPREFIKEILPSGDFQMEEERRLFYVGMTRAMDELYLTSANSYGGVRMKKISPFVLEALDVPRVAPLRTNPQEAIERYAPLVGSSPLSGCRDSTLPAPAALHLSYYQASDYITCPLKYRYIHVLRIPILPHHTIMYGKALHDAIGMYFRKKLDGIEVRLDELVSTMRASWRSDGFISKEHEEKRFNAGIESLKRFLEMEEACGKKPVSVERDFTVSLGKIILRGRWDLIEERDGEPFIIDFKTSDVRDKEKADKRAKESLQLKIYALSYLKNFNRSPAGCELRFIESGIVGEATFDEKAMEKTIAIIESVEMGLRKREFTATPNYRDCGYCPFNEICPESAA